MGAPRLSLGVWGDCWAGRCIRRTGYVIRSFCFLPGVPTAQDAGPRTVIARVVLCGHILGRVLSRGSLSMRAVTATETRVMGTSALAAQILVFSFTQLPCNKGAEAISCSPHPDCTLQTSVDNEIQGS